MKTWSSQGLSFPHFSVQGLENFSVGFNDFLIPGEAVLGDPAQIFQVLFFPVDVDETIALLVSLMGADQIHEGPGTVTDQIHAILNGQISLFQVLLIVVDAVVIMNMTIFFQNISGTHAVFRNQQGRWQWAYSRLSVVLRPTGSIFQPNSVEGR